LTFGAELALQRGPSIAFAGCCQRHVKAAWKSLDVPSGYERRL